MTVESPDVDALLRERLVLVAQYGAVNAAAKGCWRSSPLRRTRLTYSGNFFAAFTKVVVPSCAAFGGEAAFA